MNELTIELDRVPLRRELMDALRAEFLAGGLLSGRVYVGAITAAPDMVYFLWHDSGEAPVSMLIRRENFTSEDAARTAAGDFLSKWKKRQG
jgi:hypothetical protein